MRKALLWTAFGLMAAAQLFVPASMIGERELVLRNGTLYRFKAAPVDPYDAFRGRYVSVRLEALEAQETPNSPFKEHDKVYAYFNVDEAGFAHISRVLGQPEGAGDYLRLRVAYAESNKTHFENLLDRYYMPEDLAPEAERAYWEHARRNEGEEQDAFVTVRVWRGRGVIEDLYVAGMPIRKYLLQQSAGSEPK